MFLSLAIVCVCVCVCNGTIRPARVQGGVIIFAISRFPSKAYTRNSCLNIAHDLVPNAVVLWRVDFKTLSGTLLRPVTVHQVLIAAVGLLVKGGIVDLKYT
jgi:hypothetical protein